ncbi:hypothetical protein D3874_22105 [Oleomonas cavernae]|uniref:Helix-turn-helix domain-containing protein n=1 Tax=Oleomonas cavernae TaxID=2320859 RepID=A0A418WH20_9PROT|nr:hypothetical protein D3874_22105 [Oleomonas cavernae]
MGFPNRSGRFKAWAGGGGQPWTPKTYSKRVAAAVFKEGLPCHHAAARFGVAISTAINWVRRFRETGDVAPAGRSGGTGRTRPGDCCA